MYYIIFYNFHNIRYNIYLLVQKIRVNTIKIKKDNNIRKHGDIDFISQILITYVYITQMVDNFHNYKWVFLNMSKQQNFQSLYIQ